MTNIKILTQYATMGKTNPTEAPPRAESLPFKSDDLVAYRKYQKIVCIGIGGSYAGLKLMDSFLSECTFPIWDGDLLFARTVEELISLNLEYSGDEVYVITSKSGGTPETVDCSNYLIKRTAENRITPKIVYQGKGSQGLVLPIPDDVGGRFSIWATLFPIAVKYGYHNAKRIFESSLSSAINSELATIAGSVSRWDVDRMTASSTGKCVLVYDLPTTPVFDYIQQLEMESLGKKASTMTGNIVFGGYGPNLQHSIMQLIHEGSADIPCEFIVVKRKGEPTLDLWANAAAQAAAVHENQHRTESITWVLDPTIESLVELLTVWEMRTIATARFLNINPFDQPGVELGKKIAKSLVSDFQTGNTEDPLLSLLK